jgi:hypothetical protein
MREMREVGSGWRMGDCGLPATRAWMGNGGGRLRMAWKYRLPDSAKAVHYANGSSIQWLDKFGMLTPDPRFIRAFLRSATLKKCLAWFKHT